jgi:hypothetical protein
MQARRQLQRPRRSLEPHRRSPFAPPYSRKGICDYPTGRRGKPRAGTETSRSVLDVPWTGRAVAVAAYSYPEAGGTEALNCFERRWCGNRQTDHAAAASTGPSASSMSGCPVTPHRASRARTRWRCLESDAIGGGHGRSVLACNGASLVIDLHRDGLTTAGRLLLTMTLTLRRYQRNLTHT